MLSVIIPTYNEERDIEDCLLSLETQKGIQFEVLVVDDGSRDRTFKVLKKFRTRKYSLKIFEQKHKGAGAARNKGALKAKGSILVFLDADMTFTPDFLKRLTKPIKDRQTQGTFSKDEYVSNWDNAWARCWGINEGAEGQMRHHKNYPNKQKVFRAIKKNEFVKAGGFGKGGYTDDWSLSEKLGYLADEANGAIFYHKNPSTLLEVFNHAKWVGKRRYKLWLLGTLFALARASIPITLAVGVYKTIKYKAPAFLIFKIIYNTGLSWGILAYAITRRGGK